MKTLVVGCGYVGTKLGEALIAKGHEVWALRRDEAALVKLSASGFKTIHADIKRSSTFGNFEFFDYVIFAQAPSQGSDNYRDTYYLGAKNILKILENQKPKKIIFISSTSVYSTKDGSWVDESTNPMKESYESAESEANAKCLLDTERLVLSQDAPAIVLRLGGIYGPGRNRLRLIKEGKMRPSFDESYTNRIHVEDIVSAILCLFEKGKPGEIYLGVDNYPSTQKEFYSWICEKLKIRPDKNQAASETRRHGSNKRCSNEKIKELGLYFKYPSFKEGYLAILDEAENV